MMNDILAIIGLVTIALLIPCLLITFSQWFYLFVLKKAGKPINDDTKARYSSIYIPNYIKKLGRIIPKFAHNRSIKVARPIPNLEDGHENILIQDTPNIINSPISKLDESPSAQPSHAETLPQGKEGKQPNANRTLMIVNCRNIAFVV